MYTHVQNGNNTDPCHDHTRINKTAQTQTHKKHYGSHQKKQQENDRLS